MKVAIRELLEREGVAARVLDKTNAKGVIGIILEKREPRMRGE